VRQGRIVTGSVFVVDKPALNVQLAECGLGAPEAVEVLFHIFLYFGSQ
jgi:glycerol-3-phosphate responsive antiterminator